MDQQKLFEQMERQGMNTQEAMGRFMGNKPLFLSFVRQLPDKLDLTRIRQALDAEDEDAFYMGGAQPQGTGSQSEHRSHPGLCPGHSGGIPWHQIQE